MALQRAKKGEAMGPDGISVDIWKCMGEEGVDMLWDLLQKIYEQGEMPEEWLDSVIVPIFKEKVDIQECGNYRGIKLTSHTMKVWEKVIDRRLREETTMGEEQFGFMPGKGTTDAIFAARQMIEKHRDRHKELHMVFIDLESTTAGGVEMHEGEGSARKVCKNCQRHICRGKNDGEEQRRAYKHDHR